MPPHQQSHSLYTLIEREWKRRLEGSPQAFPASGASCLVEDISCQTMCFFSCLASIGSKVFQRIFWKNVPGGGPVGDDNHDDDLLKESDRDITKVN
eukprot:CAMPEP_0194041782 /NCGR_PEP_ID=MMETSP0009_2-20130614/13614_1 /TAXON_ID=210454 /ORGANISM="Grammatophora oceanica, Strain CCMP 410" /LENGTH=95 /DNA_ID=CAMNT_0038685389 /DNA_START=385 /DNA_END=672 /DNA_ORIENTATION=-